MVCYSSLFLFDLHYWILDIQLLSPCCIPLPFLYTIYGIFSLSIFGGGFGGGSGFEVGLNVETVVVYVVYNL